jgi:hypothetical protein
MKDIVSRGVAETQRKRGDEMIFPSKKLFVSARDFVAVVWSWIWRRFLRLLNSVNSEKFCNSVESAFITTRQ